MLLAAAPTIPYLRVPRLWPESTIVCVGSGPSLVPEDLETCQHHPTRPRAIVINDSWCLAPFADVLYACDATWWARQRGVPDFHGLKYSIDPRAARWPDVQILRETGQCGLETSSDGLRTGSNSGYQAINLAVHLGARRILLLGYDMRAAQGRDHWFGSHPDRQQPPFALFLRLFPTIVAPLAQLGVTVLNCSRSTALHCFPRVDLEDALRGEGSA
jgi:hypothetical protein